MAKSARKTVIVETIERSVYGPGLNRLSRAQAAKWLGIPLGTFDDLITQKKFPPGVPVAKNRLRWGWLTVVAMNEVVEWLRQTGQMPA